MNLGERILCVVKLKLEWAYLSFLKMSFSIKSTITKLEFNFLSFKSHSFPWTVIGLFLIKDCENFSSFFLT